jgi:hypothetical protein
MFSQKIFTRLVLTKDLSQKSYLKGSIQLNNQNPRCLKTSMTDWVNLKSKICSIIFQILRPWVKKYTPSRFSECLKFGISRKGMTMKA